MLKTVKTALTAVLAAALAVTPAWAITLEEAARKVAKEYNARVLSARTVTVDGRRVHEIRIMTPDGTVQTVRVPE